MTDSRPVVELDLILDWITCPMKIYRKRNRGRRVFDYESLLRYMLLNSLKAGYRDADLTGSLSLEKHVPDIWEYLLKIYGVPDPRTLIRNMNEFFAIRCRYVEQIEKRYRDSTNLLNLEHWWDLGLVFDDAYYRLRDRINGFQQLLGFPDWNIVKTYYRDCEYRPVSLADAFCDYMAGIRIFSFRKIPPGEVRFDVQTYLDLEDIRLSVRFDILWRRKKAYRTRTQKLKTGLIAEQLVPCSLFSDAEQVLRERVILRDIRMPVPGVEYKDENGRTVRVDSVTCCVFPSRPGTAAWKESAVGYDGKTVSELLSSLNRYGLVCMEAAERNLFVPRGLIKNDVCAACSFLKDCIECGMAGGKNAEA